MGMKTERNQRLTICLTLGCLVFSPCCLLGAQQPTLRYTLGGGHTQAVFAVAYSPDGNTLASGSADGTVRLWNPNTGLIIATLEGHTGSVLSVAYSPNGKVLASASGD